MPAPHKIIHNEEMFYRFVTLPKTLVSPVTIVIIREFLQFERQFNVLEHFLRTVCQMVMTHGHHHTFSQWKAFVDNVPTHIFETKGVDMVIHFRKINQ